MMNKLLDEILGDDFESGNAKISWSELGNISRYLDYSSKPMTGAERDLLLGKIDMHRDMILEDIMEVPLEWYMDPFKQTII